MENVKFSLVVPVYNVKEEWLRRCLNSAKNQTFSDFEALLVDDGSTDGSGAVCDAYAKEDFRFRVFHKENGGVSSARNLGIDKAKGEWLLFVDCDDWLDTDALKVLDERLRNVTPDLVIFNTSSLTQTKDGVKTLRRPVSLISDTMSAWGGADVLPRRQEKAHDFRKCRGQRLSFSRTFHVLFSGRKTDMGQSVPQGVS